MQVIIHSIAHQYILEDRDYKWLLEHLGQPLEVACIFFRPSASNMAHIADFSVRYNDEIITLFDLNGATVEFVGTLPKDKFNIGADLYERSEDSQY